MSARWLLAVLVLVLSLPAAADQGPPSGSGWERCTTVAGVCDKAGGEGAWEIASYQRLGYNGTPMCDGSLDDSAFALSYQYVNSYGDPVSESGSCYSTGSSGRVRDPDTVVWTRLLAPPGSGGGGSGGTFPASISLKPFDMSEEQGWAIAVAICGVWAAAWGFVAVARVLRDPPLEDE